MTSRSWPRCAQASSVGEAEARVTSVYAERPPSGYKQTLRRGMGFWGVVGVSISNMQPLLSAGVLQLGLLCVCPSTMTLAQASPPRPAAQTVARSWLCGVRFAATLNDSLLGSCEASFHFVASYPLLFSVLTRLRQTRCAFAHYRLSRLLRPFRIPCAVHGVNASASVGKRAHAHDTG